MTLLTSRIGPIILLVIGYWLLVIGTPLSTIHYPLSTPAALAADDLAIPDFKGRDPEEHPILSPCTRFDDRYDALLFPEKQVKDWSDIYHKQVDTVIEEYLKPPEIECTAEDYRELLKAGPELETLARKMPIWADGEVPVSRLDTARVLLEYLRIYECSLKEFRDYLYFDTRQEERDNRGDFEVTPFFFSDLMDEGIERAEIIKEEQTVVREALHRTLTLIGAFDRLKPLEAELVCMQKFSLDVRNAAALTAETSACMPRIWNAKDVLRDYKEDD